MPVMLVMYAIDWQVIVAVLKLVQFIYIKYVIFLNILSIFEQLQRGYVLAQLL